jgi:16S rRNA (uracil1498-N3)-methyltransferase
MPRTYKSLSRLYVEPSLGKGEVVNLGKEQGNYLLNVLRLKPGDSVVLFNGRDGAWLGRLAEAGRKEARLEIVEQAAAQTEKSDLWFGFAPLKVGRLEYLVQKATEMGAGVIQPVITQFTQVRNLRPDKLRAWALEAAEQCEVLSLPEIAPETGLEALLRNWPETQGLRHLVFADESAPSGTPVERLATLAGKRIGVLIGPEGGFSDAERALLLQQDFVLPISLGPRILRADTAAVAALTLVQSSIGDWR